MRHAPSEPRLTKRPPRRRHRFSQSLERGLLILSTRSARPAPVLGIAELARAVGLNKSTTYRYVATLAKLGYVQQDPETKRYSSARGWSTSASRRSTRWRSPGSPRPSLQALSDETGYTVSMAVLDGPDIVYVDRRRSGRANAFAMGLHLHVGSRLPAYCTSMGKVLLAHREPGELRALLDRTDLARRGPKTITSREQLMAALARVRHPGIAVNDEELGGRAALDRRPGPRRPGEVVAAVNVAIHLTIWGASVEAIARKYEQPLRRAADKYTYRLGYVSPAGPSR